MLFISLVVSGTAIPVICRFVEGKGNSKVSERISLLEELMKGLGNRKIKSVLGDREFDSRSFVEFLLNKGIDPLIRLKKNVKVSGCRAEEYFRNLAPGEARTLRGKKEIFGLKLYLAGTKDKKNRLVLVLSRHKERILEIYKKRWSIEVSFKCLKTDGFNIEKTQLESKKRILSMIQVISIAYLIVIMLGDADGKKEVIKRGYPAKSLFKKGLNLVQTTLTVFFNFNHLLVLLASPNQHKQRCVRS